MFYPNYRNENNFQTTVKIILIPKHKPMRTIYPNIIQSLDSISRKVHIDIEHINTKNIVSCRK